MKIGILSRNAKLYSTKRLKEAAVVRGHTVRVVDYTRCYMNITSHRPEASRVYLPGERLRMYGVTSEGQSSSQAGCTEVLSTAWTPPTEQSVARPRRSPVVTN